MTNKIADDDLEITPAELAGTLDTLARWLLNEQEVQLGIDTEWTTIELKPTMVKNLVAGLKLGAAMLRGAKVFVPQDAGDAESAS
jgi:hypothetical protein